MTEAQMMARIRREVDRAGGVRALAREWKISAAHLSAILLGTQRAGDKIAAKLGLTAVRSISYRYEAATAGR